MANAELLKLIQATQKALEEELAWLVDVDVDDRGRSTANFAKKDMSYVEALQEAHKSLDGVCDHLSERMWKRSA